MPEQLCQSENAVAVERGLKREVVALEGFDLGEPGHAQRRLDPAALAQRQLLGKQGVDGFECRDFAALDLAHDVIERFQGARHLEADQAMADAVQRSRSGGDRDVAHVVAPSANRCPTTA